ncbi:MAG: 2,3-bisphosphoglycerate-independent phosphoglycerate mutase [Eubacterium sp.]|nr:2,3-bisphosphoglycerate-independent phosphoglycerate mutase [Eubacterium sp.]
MKKPTVLLILDGYGINEKTEGNAIAQANTPVMDRLMKECPFVQGEASAMAVGLPEGQMGNSEVGHLNMGAGRIVYQELTRISKEIEEGTFFENESLKTAMENVKKNNSALHVFGLLSDGGVHSTLEHIYGAIEMAKREGLEKVYLHAFLDGRDTPPESAADYMAQTVEKMNEIGVGEVATVTGRYYAMDRDTNWDRTEKAYDALTKGEGVKKIDPVQAIKDSYANGVTDEFMLPTVIEKDGEAVATIKDGDSIIFCNFRPDRARQITRAFCDDQFTGFDRPKLDVVYVCYTQYDVTIPNTLIAFEKQKIVNTFGEYLANNNMKQARIAETEKYAHVTFFFNGGVEAPNEGEERILVDSPKYVPTYDKKPRMSLYTVCDELSKAILSEKYDVIICNFANPDMVGHTGVLKSAIRAIEAIDECVGEVVEFIKQIDGQMFICADHGNAEQLINYETGEPHTAHTTNPVPFIIVNADPKYKLKEGGKLADIVPTMIEMMGMEKPAEMTGESLLTE